MKKLLLLSVGAVVCLQQLSAQVEPDAGNWKTWFIASGKDLRLLLERARADGADTRQKLLAKKATAKPIMK